MTQPRKISLKVSGHDCASVSSIWKYGYGPGTRSDSQNKGNFPDMWHTFHESRLRLIPSLSLHGTSKANRRHLLEGFLTWKNRSWIGNSEGTSGSISAVDLPNALRGIFMGPVSALNILVRPVRTTQDHSDNLGWIPLSFNTLGSKQLHLVLVVLY